MRTLQMSVGILVIAVGVLILLAVNGFIALRILDIAGIALIVSGLLFWIPGLIWRQSLPWLTSLFIPGSFTLAVGAIVIYVGRSRTSDFWYLWPIALVALGIAFLAMYYLGPRVRVLWIVGMLIGGISLLLLGLLLVLLSPEAAARVVGSAILIGLGIVIAISALAPRRTPAHLANPRQ